MPVWLITLLAKILQPVVEQILKNIGLYFDNKKIDDQVQATASAMDESQKAVSEDERKKAIRDIANALSR